MIETSIYNLLTSQQNELKNILNQRNPSEYVSDLPLILLLLILIPIGLIGVYAFFSYKGSISSKIIWSFSKFPEYGILYIAFFALSIFFLFIMGNYLMKFHSHGYVNTSFGLVQVNGSHLKIYPYSDINSLQIEQVSTKYYFNAETGQWGNFQQGSLEEYEGKAENHSLIAGFKSQIEREVIVFKNFKNAESFFLKLKEKMLENNEIQLPASEKFISAPLKWIAAFLFSLFVSALFVVFIFFPFHNKRVYEQAKDDIFFKREPSNANLTDDMRYLKDYLYLLPKGDYSGMVKDKLKVKFKEKIDEIRNKILINKDTSYKYMLLGTYTDYLSICPDDVLIRKEYELIEQDKFEEFYQFHKK